MGEKRRPEKSILRQTFLFANSRSEVELNSNENIKVSAAAANDFRRSRNRKFLQYFKPTCLPTQSLSLWETSFSFPCSLAFMEKYKIGQRSIRLFQGFPSNVGLSWRWLLKPGHLNKSIVTWALREKGLCCEDFLSSKCGRECGALFTREASSKNEFAMKSDTSTLAGLSFHETSNKLGFCSRFHCFCSHGTGKAKQKLFGLAFSAESNPIFPFMARQQKLVWFAV